MGTLPMFPLGTVLVPSAVLALHVFEERYRAMVRRCLAGGREFGVVLIERGSEVGGADVRSDTGTIARIVEAAELPDGRWALGVIGVRRARVLRWLPDDPYPIAAVEDWPDERPDELEPARLSTTVARLRRALALASEVGDRAAPATIELSADLALATHQVAAAAPLGPLDRQRALCAPGPVERLALLDILLDEVIEVLELRLRGA